MATINVRVFHTNNFRDARFKPPGTYPVTEVFRYITELPEDRPAGESGLDWDHRVLNEAFRLCNVGEDPDFNDVPDPRAVAYRRPSYVHGSNNRSLSVGDTVGVDGRFYQVMPIGWAAVDRIVLEPDNHEELSHPYAEPDGPEEGMVTVLDDGAFRIDWNQAHTFSVYVLGREVNAFTTDHDVPLTAGQARAEAAEWWYPEGKASTQEVVRNTFATQH